MAALFALGGMTVRIDGIDITIKNVPDITEEEILRYIKFLRKRLSEPLTTIVISMTEDGRIGLDYTTQGQKFERIRRITGYLVGTIDRWNNAKKAEESERVKHD